SFGNEISLVLLYLVEFAFSRFLGEDVVTHVHIPCFQVWIKNHAYDFLIFYEDLFYLAFIVAPDLSRDPLNLLRAIFISPLDDHRHHKTARVLQRYLVNVLALEFLANCIVVDPIPKVAVLVLRRIENCKFCRPATEINWL